MQYFFYEQPTQSGWFKVKPPTAFLNNPSSLNPGKASDAAVLARIAAGDRVIPYESLVYPDLKVGEKAELWANHDEGLVEYRVAVDPECRIPVVEFLGMLPFAAVAQARALSATDPILKAFFDLLQMSVDDNASRGVNPYGNTIRGALAYLVQIGLMTQQQVDEVTTPQ